MVQYRVSCALALFVCVSACAGNTKPASPEYGLATRMDQRTAAVVSKAGSKNLVTDSDTLGGWTLDGGFVLRPVAKGGKEAELTGTGVPTGADIYSGVITVKPGAKYTFSVWADPSHFSKSPPMLMVMKPSRDVAYGVEFHFSGAPGRFKGTVTIPNDVTQVRLDVGGAGGTLAKKQKFRVSQPVFMAGSI
ncbi:MAG TPA: hypothetical protein VFO29_09810 [Candidatus Rubrimentiphilum sp.]|nr:hypothetical protein [Candidatus Rubrimentiphilum sp.]